jgi:hypothetical protein
MLISQLATPHEPDCWGSYDPITHTRSHYDRRGPDQLDSIPNMPYLGAWPTATATGAARMIVATTATIHSSVVIRGDRMASLHRAALSGSNQAQADGSAGGRGKLGSDFLDRGEIGVSSRGNRCQFECH